MPELDGKYVIMLWGHIDEFPKHWPIVTVDDSLGAARGRTQFDHIVTQPPRSAFAARLLENKQLRDSQGVTHKGGIFQMLAP